MSGDWWVISTDGPYRRAGDMIVGPCTRDWAEGYRRVSSSAVDILPGDRVTDEQKQRSIPGDIEKDRVSACICDHPHADHQQTPAGPAGCDLCDCPAYAPRPAWQDVLPGQGCPRCREQHPGQTCHLEQLAQPLPF